MGGFGGLQVHVGPTTGSQQFTSTPYKKHKAAEEAALSMSMSSPKSSKEVRKSVAPLTASDLVNSSLLSPMQQSPNASIVRSPRFRKWGFERDSSTTETINQFYETHPAVTVAPIPPEDADAIPPPLTSSRTESVELLPEDTKDLIRRMDMLRIQQQQLDTEIQLLESGRGDPRIVQVRGLSLFKPTAQIYTESRYSSMYVK